MNERFVLVSIAERKKLFSLSDVQEITALMALSEIDGQQGSCRGVADLRGAIVPVFDPRGAHAPLSPSRFVLICSAQAGGHAVGIIVDDVLDVVTVPAAQIERCPAGSGRTRAVVRLNDELLNVLEPADVLARET